MGVQGLWELLTPVGRRVSVDSLGNKKLAVDASIWIIQFMKAMRDEHGDMIRNAHLLGFFRRICKLLYLRIKPVFVFDGGTPVMKRRTLIARRRQRENAQFKIRKTAEKLLLNHAPSAKNKKKKILKVLSSSTARACRLITIIRSRKLEEIASEINSGPRKTPSQQPSQTVDISNKSSGPAILQGSVGKGAEVGPDCATFAEKSDQEAADALLAASIAAGYGQNTETENGVVEEIIEASDDDNEVEELVLPSNVKGLDPAVLASLPASMQLELLVQMREQLVAENRQKFQKVSKLPSSFSQLQIQAYLKTVAFRREITEAQRAAGGGGVGGVPTTRIASTADREFIFSNSFQGEKPAPSTIEEQRRLQQATSGTKEEVSGLFAGSKSKLFSAIAKSQTSPVEKVPEEGVVSLVSTEMNGEPESNTSCSVQTYIDEKGYVRVSRVRGMGVRMTRDLQWNLYLMKDVEARKTLESGTFSDPPIIPSNSTVDSPMSLVKDSFDGLASKEGLQISFVHDGNSDYCKDGDLFEELVMVKGNDEVTDPEGSSLSGKNDERLRVPNTEEEDDFEWEEGVVDKSLDFSVEEEKAECCQVSEVPTSASISEGLNSGDLVVRRKEEEDEAQKADDREEGGFGVGIDYSVVEDRDLAEALELSLTGKDGAFHTEEPNEHVIVEDGPSSDESEVEWEDGTGAVTVTGLDGVAADTDTSKIQSGSSEEAQIQEAIRRSLEDFRSPANVSSRLVIKEPSEDNPNSSGHVKEAAAERSPLLRAEAESEEIYFARERTRKGKARLGEEETVPHQFVPIISQTPAEQGTCADTVFVKTACIEDPPQTVAGVIEKNSSYTENQVGGTVFEPSNVSTAERSYSQHVEGGDPVSEPILNSHVQFAPVTADSVVSEGDFKVPPKCDPSTSPNPSSEDNVPLERGSQGQVAPCTGANNLAAQLTSGNEVDSQNGVLGRFAGQVSTKAPAQPCQPSSDVELLRDAEQMDVEKEREALRFHEAQVLFERERLAREEEELQAELEAEREEIQAGLERERELLAREELELRATQKKNERNADSVTGEMFTDVQELLRMFGLPYVVAPMEAEAQCAYLDGTNLVDGVVTEDSDVFLFGGQNVYKNLFDDRKYVETYYMKDLESEMGMNREKLIRMALLLGSDYTEGISGIGIVNAIEVVNAFEEEDGLQKFRMWVDSPDLSLFSKVRVRAKGKGPGKGRAKVKASGGEGENIEEDEVSEGGDVDQTEDNRFTPRQRIFISEHRAVSKNWNVPDSFPSAAVIAAYISPMIDKSKETFSFGRPDLEALRRFCSEKFGWNKDKADELLLPVLKEYDRRETQTRLDSFYHFSHRFAKIRSRRIQKAVTGITGQRSEELMDLPPHLVVSPTAEKSTKRKKTSKLKDEIIGPQGINQPSPRVDGEPTSTANGAHAGSVRGGRGRRGRGRGRSRTLATSGEVENEEEVENGEGGQRVTNKKAYGRGKGRGRVTDDSGATRRSTGSGKYRGNDLEADESSSDASKSEEIMEEVKSLKRKASQLSPAVRRSTRRVGQVSYVLDNSDEDAGGACSDGEIQAAELAEKSAHDKTKELPQGPHAYSSESLSGVANMDPDRPSSGVPFNVQVYQSGGGFCLEESGGSEEAGQLHFEKEEPSCLAHGGGFCLDEDEVTLENLELGVSGVKGQEQQPDFTLGGGCHVPDDEEEALAETSEIAEHNYRNQHSGPENLESGKDQNSDCKGSPRVARVTDDVTSPVKQPTDDCGEPVELGLRAMPMMRRKKRKSG